MENKSYSCANITFNSFVLKQCFCLLFFKRSKHQDWGVWCSQSTHAGVAVSQIAGSCPARELHIESMQQSFYVSFLHLMLLCDRICACIQISLLEESLKLLNLCVSPVGFFLTRICFRLTKQQMKWEEFVILNVVITSMLSRLWWVSLLPCVC